MSIPRRPKILRPQEGTWLWWLGHPICYLALGSETEDRFAICRGVPPSGFSPPRHRHNFEEGFFLLQGELTFTAGNETVRLEAGGFLNIAAMVGHTFINSAPDPAEMLVIVGPAGFDRFQVEAGKPLPNPAGPLDPVTPADLAKMVAAAPKYEIDLHPPAEAFEVAPNITLRKPGEGRCLAVVGDLYTFLVTADGTDCRYALLHAKVSPGGGPPPHVHRREEEAFYVITGAVSFWAEDEKVTLGPGSFAHVPIGCLHTFKNETSQPAEMLILVAPAGLEKMFEEVGKPWNDRTVLPPGVGADEIAKLLTIAPRFGVEIHIPGNGD